MTDSTNAHAISDAAAGQPAAQGVHAKTTDPAVQTARRWLALGVSALALGLSVRAFRGQGQIADYLFLYTSASEQLALMVEFIGGCVLLALLPVFAFRNMWPLIGFIPVWVLAAAWAWRSDASQYGDMVWGAHGIRYMAPLALMLLCWNPAWIKNEVVNIRCVIGMLRIGLAATFAFHGLEALLLLPDFLDYAQSAVAVLGLQIGDATAAKMLRVIGSWDILLAISVLVTRWRWPLYAMAAWGAATAGLRLLDGWWYYPETILRLIHVLPAVAILILSRTCTSSAPIDETKGQPYAVAQAQ